MFWMLLKKVGNKELKEWQNMMNHSLVMSGMNILAKWEAQVIMSKDPDIFFKKISALHFNIGI